MCSFKNLESFECGTVADGVHLPKEVVPLNSCVRDVSRHLANIQVRAIETENQLILTRVGLFSLNDNILATYSICPKHRLRLGSGWSQWDKGRKKCKYLAHQGKSKADRTINKSVSKQIWEEFHKIVPVGFGKSSNDRSNLLFSLTVLAFFIRKQSFFDSSKKKS